MSEKKSSGRTHNVLDLCDQALAVSEEEREAFLNKACAGDERLRASVESVLVAIDDSDEFLESTASDEGPFQAMPDTIGRYAVIEKIGQGGMGAVYLGERREDDFTQRVAIKTIRRHLRAPELLRRFQDEQKIVAGLSHPFIAGLIDGGTTSDGMPYLVLEYVEGQAIDEYCDERSLSVQQRLDLIRKVAMAIQAAHKNLVVHRDIKPSNVLITSDGIPKLLDFGIAKLLDINTDAAPGNTTIFGHQPMTPDYASPEQVLEGKVTTASDVYSLGVLTYQLLTGERPYRIETGSHRELLQAIENITVPRPSARLATVPAATLNNIATQRATTPARLARTLHGDLDTILMKALHREPDRRYESVAAYSDDLKRFVDGLPVEARGDSVGYRVGRFVSRHRLAVSATVTALSLLVAALGVSVWAYLGAERARADAAERFEQVRSIATTMMFDLYDDMEKVPGTYSAREKLAATAQSYLEKLAVSDDAPVDVRFDAARGYSRLRKMYNRQSVADPEAREIAKRATETALAMFADLKTQHPEPGRVYHELGSLRMRIASDYIYINNDPEKGREELDGALLALAEAERLRPDDVEIVADRLMAQRRYGDSYKWQNKFVEAEKILIPVLAEAATLRQRAPDSKRLTKVEADVGTLLSEVRYFDEQLEPAIAGYEESLALYREALRLGGPDRRITAAMAIAHWSLGNAQLETGLAEASIGNQDAALEIVGLQIARDPDDVNAGRRQAIFMASKAEALASLGRVDDAMALMLETNDWFVEQVTKDPTTPGVHRSVAVNYQITADLLVDAGRTDEVCVWWGRTLEKWQEIDATFGISDFDEPEIGKLEKLLEDCRG